MRVQQAGRRWISSVVAGTALLAALVLSGSQVNAEYQGVTGKKLLLKSKPQMVLLSKDALVVPGDTFSSADPRCASLGGHGFGGSVRLDDGTTSVTLPMPCANWTTIGNGYLYKDTDATITPKIAKLKAGRLKVVSPGFFLSVPNGAATVDVDVTVGTDIYCMTFSGSGDGDKFLVKDAAAGACVPNQTCGNNTREGTEECDGTDDAACPNDCLGDCTCAPPCGGGCDAFQNQTPCFECCSAEMPCLSACVYAEFLLCTSSIANDDCNLAITAAGCAAECCQ